MRTQCAIWARQQGRTGVRQPAWRAARVGRAARPGGRGRIRARRRVHAEERAAPTTKVKADRVI